MQKAMKRALLLSVLVVLLLVSTPVEGCNLTNGEVYIYINFTDGGPCPVNPLNPEEGWQNITYVAKDTTWVKLMKCEEKERDNLALIDLRKDAESLIESNKGIVDESARINLAGYDAARAVGNRDGEPWYAFEVRVAPSHLVVVTTKSKVDYNDALNMTIQTLHG